MITVTINLPDNLEVEQEFPAETGLDDVRKECLKLYPELSSLVIVWARKVINVKDGKCVWELPA